MDDFGVKYYRHCETGAVVNELPDVETLDVDCCGFKSSPCPEHKFSEWETRYRHNMEPYEYNTSTKLKRAIGSGGNVASVPESTALTPNPGCSSCSERPQDVVLDGEDCYTDAKGEIKLHTRIQPADFDETSLKRLFDFWIQSRQIEQWDGCSSKDLVYQFLSLLKDESYAKDDVQDFLGSIHKICQDQVQTDSSEDPDETAKILAYFDEIFADTGDKPPTSAPSSQV